MDHPRTKSFNDVLGQQHALDILRAAAASDRVHHAWIFSGPQGVGKQLTAEAFAALVLDPTTEPNLTGQLEPDPTSETQRLIASGAHPDLHIITKELARFSDDKKIRDRKLTTIPKDVIDQHLLKPIALAPTISTSARASKVFIIDEAELLDRSITNAPVQNSILKTLEEPPPGSLIILITSADDRLLPTIRSRCQRVVFQPLCRDDLNTWRERHLPDVDPDEWSWLRDFCDGSPGQALLAHQTHLHLWASEIDPLLDQADAGRFPPNLGSTLASCIDDWAKTWVKDHPGASKEAANHAATGHMLSMIARRARLALRQAATDHDEPAQNRALKIIDTLTMSQRDVSANVPLAHAMEHLAAQLAR